MADDLIEFEGGVLVADLVQEATITDTSELTQYAVEDGSLIADHIIRQPRTLALTLVQTETPISETSGFARAMQALTYQTRTAGQQTVTVPVRQSEFRPAPLMALSAGIQSLLFGGGPAKEVRVTGLKADTALTSKDLKVHVLSAGAPVARVNEFHANLLSLLDTATPVFVHVKGATYIDLVFTSVTRTDASGQAGKASFRVELRQISTVETKTVDLPPVPKAKGAKQAGAKAAAETNAGQKAKLRSALLQLGQGAGLQE